MKLLLLGGTSDALRLCRVALLKYDVIYSIKGHVRQPQLNCQVHSGGFGGTQGLIIFLQQQHIDCILDATHPYAVKISDHAQLAAKYCRINCFHYSRPAWQQQANDHWIFFNTMERLEQLLSEDENKTLQIFFTIGQLASVIIAKKQPHQNYIIRSALDMPVDLGNTVLWIKSIGPFTLEDELKLFTGYGIDALVSKNSGGYSICAKIQVAREMGLPVYMLQRPDFQSDYPVFYSIDKLLLALRDMPKMNSLFV
jgi:precorrin-6A/cobalt-precorrin-6A reductase